VIEERKLIIVGEGTVMAVGHEGMILTDGKVEVWLRKDD
jgi:hypothetical protein